METAKKYIAAIAAIAAAAGHKEKNVFGKAVAPTLKSKPEGLTLEWGRDRVIIDDPASSASWAAAAKAMLARKGLTVGGVAWEGGVLAEGGLLRQDRVAGFIKGVGAARVSASDGLVWAGEVCWLSEARAVFEQTLKGLQAAFPFVDFYIDNTGTVVWHGRIEEGDLPVPGLPEGVVAKIEVARKVPLEVSQIIREPLEAAVKLLNEQAIIDGIMEAIEQGRLPHDREILDAAWSWVKGHPDDVCNRGPHACVEMLVKAFHAERMAS